MKLQSRTVSAKTREKRRDVLTHALRCFTEHGVSGTTIEMIRDASGVSVGSLYHHFGNKERIASALFREGMRDFGEVVKEYLSELVERSPQASLEAGVKVVVYANVDWIAENPDWAQFVFHHREVVSQSGDEDALREDMVAFMQMVKGFIQQLDTRDEVFSDWAFISALISGPTHNYARQWLAGRVRTPLVDYREKLADAGWAAVQSLFRIGTESGS